MERIDLLEADAQRSLRRVPVARLSDKTVLITGASGIVGTQLLYGLQYCQEQLGLEIQVIGLVRHGIPDHLKLMEQRGHARFLCGDMADSAFVTGLPTADIIVHAATYGQPGLFMAEPIRTLKLNTTATMTLLEKLRPAGQFLFISTSELYSGLSSPPYCEDQIGITNTTHPRSCYIEAKRCGEAICSAARSAGVEAKCARLCLAYGPGVRRGDKRALNSFIEKALLYDVIDLLDNGDAHRTYCYISDAAYMLWRILLEGSDLVYNVGGISNCTIGELARLVGKILNVPVRIPQGRCGGLAGAPSHIQLNLSKFHAEFGEIDFIGLQHGIEATVEWQKSLYIRSVEGIS